MDKGKNKWQMQRGYKTWLYLIILQKESAGENKKNWTENTIYKILEAESHNDLRKTFWEYDLGK